MPAKKSDQEQFLRYVQLHERSWGRKQYKGRPDLAAIMTANVVVFWQDDNDKTPYTITLFDDLKDIEKFFLRLLFSSQVEPSKKRIARIYRNQKRVTVRAVRILFGEVEE